MRALCPRCREEVTLQLAGFGRMRWPACGSFHDASAIRTTDEARVGPPKKPRRRRRRYRR